MKNNLNSLLKLLAFFYSKIIRIGGLKSFSIGEGFRMRSRKHELVNNFINSIFTIKNISLILFLFFSFFAKSQTIIEAPKLEYVCELKVKLKPAIVVGETPKGLRRIIPITGGSFEGPNMKGEILDGGADWQFVRKDGVAELEAHYQIKTDDGVIIYIKNVGLRVATPEVAARIGRGEKVSSSEYYFRTVPKFEAPVGKYDWMNNAIFICTAERNPDNVSIKVWRVL